MDHEFHGDSQWVNWCIKMITDLWAFEWCLIHTVWLIAMTSFRLEEKQKFLRNFNKLKLFLEVAIPWTLCAQETWAHLSLIVTCGACLIGGGAARWFALIGSRIVRRQSHSTPEYGICRPLATSKLDQFTFRLGTLFHDETLNFQVILWNFNILKKILSNLKFVKR